MGQKSFTSAKIQRLTVLLNFADMHFEFPDAGNNANAITILNSGTGDGFPGNARDIAFDDSLETFSANCISMVKVKDGVTLKWRLHIQTTNPTSSAIWAKVKEFSEFFAAQTLSTLYIDDTT